MEVPDKSWMNLRRDDLNYIQGVDMFIDFTVKSVKRDSIACPCVKCANRTYKHRTVVRGHLIAYGIRQNYNFWYFHGETRSSIERNNSTNVSTDNEKDELDIVDNIIDEQTDVCDDQFMEDIIDDLYHNGKASSNEHHVDDAKAFYRLLDDSKLPLYDGFRISKVSALLKLLHIKNVGQWTNTSFDLLLRLLKEEILPVNSQLPSSYYECKKFIADIGLTYDKIDACKNDCMLFRKEDKDLPKCKICGLSRWKINQSSGALQKKVNGKLIPNKILRYFPLAPRLQRLYMCSKTASRMTWHKDNNTDDEELKHPVNSMAWRSFDERFKHFSSEPRNVRLGLASNDFQPFASGKISYSIWPVILIPYNVPPAICMDTSNFIISMLIPGPKSPGDSIDVFLQPLIDELKELWNTGVMTYDASRSEYFNMRAAILWTINDFSAYTNLSGWSTKGKLACPCCNKKTSSLRLVHCQKDCYMSHRRFLSTNHRWRKERDTFDGHTELREPPEILSGIEVLLQARDLKGICLTKDRTKRTKISHEARGDNWNKLSIFFELPYWRSLFLRHNLDVMHIEKNICDSVLGTIMDIKEKSKDGLRARKDLQLLNIKQSLHPVEVDGVVTYPAAPYTLSSEQKKRLCQFLKDVKMPEGFCSNIRGCVNIIDMKISELKSHEYHILLQYLIPLATRSLLSDDVYDALWRLSKFFRLLCQKTLKKDQLEDMNDDIILTLCKLEKIFPPSFFDIVVHLPVHLTFEAFLGGPVQYRWMYPVEQYMDTLKKYFRNKNFPEGSISESYLLHESMSLCARYSEDHESIETSIHTSLDLSIFLTLEDLSIGTLYTYEPGDRERVHVYILKNCFEAEQYYNEFMQELTDMGGPLLSNHERDRLYINFFKTKVAHLIDDSDRTLSLKILGGGPTIHAKKYNSCKINGYKFNTEQHDDGLTTQNSGVIVIGNNGSAIINYYGVLTDIIEVQYLGGKRVIIFKCRWFDVHSKDSGIKIDKYGFESVNVNMTLKTQNHEPFVLASKAQQVFYVTDMASGPGWKIVININPRNESLRGRTDGDNDFDPLTFMASFPEIEGLLPDSDSDSTIPPDLVDDDNTVSPSQPDTGSSSRRGRDKNKNTTIGKLPVGKKMRLEFNDIGKPCCDNSTHWSTHIDTIIRDPTVVPHKTVHWSDLSSTQLDHIWRSISDPFNAVPNHIDTYRAGRMAQAKQIWDKWRYKNHKDYIKPHEGDEQTIRANPPPQFSHSDWNYLLERYYFSPEFRRKSESNAKNISNVEYLNHAGSIPFTQVEMQMRATGRRPDILETHRKRACTENRTPVPNQEVQSRATALSEKQKENPHMLRFEVTKSVFGPQAHERVIEMGSEVRPTTFRSNQMGSSSSRSSTQQERADTQALQDHNKMLREDMEQMRAQYGKDMQQMRAQQDLLQSQMAQMAEILGRLAPPPPPPSQP